MEKVPYGFTAVFQHEPEGGYSVSVPTLPGAISQGDTLDEARENIREAIRGILVSRRRHGLPIPAEDEEVSDDPIREKVTVEIAR